MPSAPPAASRRGARSTESGSQIYKSFASFSSQRLTSTPPFVHPLSQRVSPRCSPLPTLFFLMWLYYNCGNYLVATLETFNSKLTKLLPLSCGLSLLKSSSRTDNRSV